jgi:hypothetical protein
MERSAEWSGREAEPTLCRIRRRTSADPVRVCAVLSGPAPGPRSKGMRTFAPRQGDGGAPRRRNGARSGMEDGRATASAGESARAVAGARLRSGRCGGRATVDRCRPGLGGLRRAPESVRGVLPWAEVAGVLGELLGAWVAGLSRGGVASWLSTAWFYRRSLRSCRLAALSLRSGLPTATRSARLVLTAPRRPTAHRRDFPGYSPL